MKQKFFERNDTPKNRIEILLNSDLSIQYFFRLFRLFSITFFFVSVFNRKLEKWEKIGQLIKSEKKSFLIESKSM